MLKKETGKEEDAFEYWSHCKKLLSSKPPILQKMKDFDKDNAPPDIIEKMTPVIKEEGF